MFSIILQKFDLKWCSYASATTLYRTNQHNDAKKFKRDLIVNLLIERGEGISVPDEKPDGPLGNQQEEITVEPNHLERKYLTPFFPKKYVHALLGFQMYAS